MDFNVYDIAIVPLIIGLISVLTALGLPKKFAPIAAITFGVVAGVTYVAPADVAQGAIVGVALGLAAVGLYSGTKNTVKSEE